MKGIITKGIGGFYYVRAEDGALYECKARGIFRKNSIKPTIGDYVETDGRSIDKIYPRRSYLVRPNVANIDRLIIVIAAASPAPDLMLTDKLTVAALSAGIEPVICINKTDLAEADEIKSIYESSGFMVIEASAELGQGTDELQGVISGKVSAFAGLSGVGKSSILNLLCGGIAETGEVSRINRGRHTTRHVELFEPERGTYILDTPGFSSLKITEICDVKAAELAEYFPEFAAAYECRFKGCAHITEPDCGVKALVDEKKVAKSRYESYTQLYAQLKEVKDWENK